MKVSIVDLRYRMKEVLRAMEMNEDVYVMYHNKPKGILKPIASKTEGCVEDHPLFGINKKDKRSVAKVMEEIRKERYRDF